MSLIAEVIRSYYPDWEPPKDNGKEWIQTTCPFHGDSRPSASVSFRNDAFKCFVCPATGDAIGIIMREEGVSYKQALSHAESVSPGSATKVHEKPAGKPRRRVFGDSGVPTNGPSDEHRKSVQAGLRGRPTPWS